MNEFSLTTCDSLFARIEEDFSAYSMNGLLDTSRWYAEVKWFIQQIGLSAYEQSEGMILLEKHRAILPCDFYQLDSAWLCSPSTQAINNYFQGKYVFYTEETCEKLINNQSCPLPNNTGYSVNTSIKDKVLEKITIKEYVTGGNNWLEFNNPVMLRYNNRKSIGTFCNKSCPNLFVNTPDEISINKQGDTLYLNSTLEDASIYIKYWRYPMDMETGLPLIIDNPIVQKGLEFHLKHWFLVNLWLNDSDVNLENKIKYMEGEKTKWMLEAKMFVKTPSFQDMIQIARNTRQRWNTYNIRNTHY